MPRLMKSQYERLTELEEEVKDLTRYTRELEETLTDEITRNAMNKCACGGQSCGPTYTPTGDK